MHNRNRLLILLFSFSLSSLGLNAQTTDSPDEIAKITATLMDYIDGTGKGEPDRIKRAFHKDLNLYSIGNDTLKLTSGKKYISYFKQGEKSNRIGSIKAIDFVNDAASARVEIIMPARKRVYTDYLLLLKIEGHWKIIHKSYTYVEYPEEK